MITILFIGSLPLPLNKGSNQHAYFFLKSLSLIFNVHCLFFNQNRLGLSSEFHKDLMDTGIESYAITNPKTLRNKNKFVNFVKDVFTFPYLYLKTMTTEEGSFVINEIIERHKIDIVHIESLHYAWYIRKLPLSVKVSFVFHDLYHRVLYEQSRVENKLRLKTKRMADSIKIYFFELYLLKKVNAAIFLNREEMPSKKNNVFYIPHIANPQIRPSYNIIQSNSYNILFLGGYNHPPNVFSFKFLVDKILPELRESHLQFCINVVGNSSENYKKLIKNPSDLKYFKFRGYVSDINEVFQDVDLALFPIVYGGGIKTKIIEAMAAGVPIVTTPSGVFGLNDHIKSIIMCSRNHKELSTNVIYLLKNTDIRKKISLTGINLIKEYHSEKELQSAVEHTYQHIFGDTKL